MPMNDLVDRLAVEAAANAAAPLGRRAADHARSARPARTRGRGRSTRHAGVGREALDAGHRHSCVFGHRPPDARWLRRQPRRRRRARPAASRSSRPRPSCTTTCSSCPGCGSGPRCCGAEAARRAGPAPRRRAAVPRSRDGVAPGVPDSASTPSCARAEQVITLQRQAPTTKQQAGAAASRRDAWLARNAAEAVLVWDGDDERLRDLHRSLEDHLGEDVWLVDPAELTVRPRGARWRPGSGRPARCGAPGGRGSCPRVGSDTGGTFTDLVLDDGTIAKVPVHAGRSGRGGAPRPRRPGRCR